MPLKRIQRVVIVAGLLCLWATSAPAQSTVTLIVSNSAGYAIPSDFAGLSFEIRSQRPDRGGWAGNLFSPTNTQLVTLFQNIGLHSLRMGGATVDGANASRLDRVDIDHLFAFARAAGGLKVIYSLQLLNGDARADAGTAEYIWQKYRSALDSFSIGNEPDWRSYAARPHGGGSDPQITGYASYLAKWKQIATTITNRIPGATFSGPDTGANFDLGAPGGEKGFWAHPGIEWTKAFAKDTSGTKLVTLITQHHYQADKQHKSPTPTNAAQFIDAMLSPEWDAVTNQTLYNVMAAPILSNGLTYRFTEANEVVGGVTNASDTFAAALWALDFLHWWAAHRCAGVNFHNKPWLLTDTIYFDQPSHSYQVRPKAYGIKAFNLGAHGREQPLKIVNTNDLNLAAYAAADATALYITVINREHDSGARDAGVAIDLGGFSTAGSAAAMYLTTPDGNMAAKAGITLGGATIRNDTPWAGQWTELAPVSNNCCALKVPASSAAVVKIALNGPSLTDFWEGRGKWVKDADQIGRDFGFHFISIHQEDGQLYAYYINGYTAADGRSKMSIGRARGRDGIHWTNDGRVLDVGRSAPEEWDDRITSFPGIWKDGGAWYLAYEGASETGLSRGDIGLATSTDGQHFVKYSNNPLLRHNVSDWERANIGTPSLFRENGIWYLFYHGYDFNVCQIAVASGPTLTNLVKSPANPILPVTPDTFAWDSGTTGRRSAIAREGPYYYMAFEGSTPPPFAYSKWSSGLARTTNLLSRWTKFPRNPIIPQTPGGMGNDGPEMLRLNGTWYLYVRTPDGTARYRLEAAH